jgi:SAM-dependent methyltransferase
MEFILVYLSFLRRIARRVPALVGIVAVFRRLRRKVAFFSGRYGGDRAVKSLKSGADYCHCCRRETSFKIEGDWLRDQYKCTRCGSIPRQRHIQYVMDSYFRGWERRKIHESSPSNTLISRYCDDYSSSQYFDGVEPGCSVKGVRCENLEALTFEDESFDLFITQDVFEHIFNPERAAREIMRVLKPGGAHIFTAPKHKGIPSSYPRAKLIGTQVEHIHEPSYHGNPIGDGRVLVTWDYGDDFESLMNSWSDSVTTTFITKDRRLGLDGEYLEVFVTRKPGLLPSL